MTDAAIQALIDAARTGSSDLVTWLELKAILEGLKTQVSLTDLGTPTEGKIPKVVGGAWALADDNEATATDGLWVQVGDTIKPDVGRAMWFTNATDVEVFEVIEPSNYGATYATYLGEPSGVADRFYRGWAMNPSSNPVSGRPDVVGTMWSYNHQMGGARYNTSEAGFGFRTETHFETGGQQLFEFHMPAFVGLDGIEHRLFSWYIPKSGTAGAGGPRIETDILELKVWGDQNTGYASLSQDGQIIINTAVDGSTFPKVKIGSLLETVNGVTSSLWAAEFMSQGNVVLIQHVDTSFSQANPAVRLQTNDNFWIGSTPGYGGVPANERGFWLGGYMQQWCTLASWDAMNIVHTNRNRIAYFGYSDTELSFAVHKEAIRVRNGTTANRPSGGDLLSGMIRFNTTTSKFEGYNGSTWVDFH